MNAIERMIAAFMGQEPTANADAWNTYGSITGSSLVPFTFGDTVSNPIPGEMRFLLVGGTYQLSFWSGTAWTYITMPDATATITGGIRLTGQLGGTATSPTVTGITGAIVGISNISATGTPSASTFLRGDGSWQAASGSYTLPAATAVVRGGITVGSRLTITGDVLSADVQTTAPAGSNTYVQFNDSAVMGGTSGLTFDKATSKLTCGGEIASTLNITCGRTFVTAAGTASASSMYWAAGVGQTVSTAGDMYADANGIYYRTTAGWNNLTYFTPPAGSNTQVQFNDGGAFAGNSALTFTKASGLLSATVLVSTTDVITGSASSFLALTANSARLVGQVSDGGTAVGTVLDNTTTLATTGAKLLSVRNNTVDKFHVLYDGTMNAVGNVVAYFSDIRLKENISKISDPLTKLKALNGVNWVWNEEECMKAGFMPDSVMDTGVIAQEVQAVLPHAVGRAANPEYLALKTSNHGLVALLIEAVKAQQARIEDLEKRIDGLQGGSPWNRRY
jgi:hypothetical protein